MQQGLKKTFPFVSDHERLDCTTELLDSEEGFVKEQKLEKILQKASCARGVDISEELEKGICQHNPAWTA